MTVDVLDGQGETASEGVLENLYCSFLPQTATYYQTWNMLYGPPT